LEKKTLKVLEFNKIVELLKIETTNLISSNKAENLMPCTAVSVADLLQEELKETINLILKNGNPRVNSMKEITTSLKRIEMGGILNNSELLSIAEVFRIARTLTSYYNVNSVLDVYFDELTSDKKIEDSIFSSIISETEIADTASAELANIRRQITNTHAKIREHLNSIIHSTKYQKVLQEAIVTVRDGRYVVPVKAEHKADVSGIVHDMSSTGSTLFIEPNAVVSANNLLRELAAKEKNEIEKILQNLTLIIADRVHDLFVNQKNIAEIDFLLAKAKLALKMNAIIPRLNDEGIIAIEKGRHPLLDQKSVVPVSVRLGSDFKTLVITGPNTGGKTVILKTIGLFCIMAASGLAIPAADGTNICILEQIFADIGDEQSIEQSLSTFSSHMTNIVHILENITPNSLVLFDELGAGTDPTEGAALAIAILKYTKDMGCITVATTHYSEIKLYALSTEGVENASCEFDVNSLKPTYKILIGVPGKSNAFAISKRLGLPDFIINNAAEHLSEENIKFEDVISNLEKSRQLAEKEHEVANTYKRDIEVLKNELQKEKNKFEETKEKLKTAANYEAKKIIEQAKHDADEIINEIKNAQKLQNQQELNKTLTDAKTKLNTKLKDVTSSQINKVKEAGNATKSLKVGTTVRILDIDQTGTVLTAPKEDGTVNLMVGIMKITSNISNLRVSENEKNNKVISKSRSGGMRSGIIKPELDLRGLMLEDAILMTEKYIDDACLYSLNQVMIIHGKGTGVLRKGIHTMLKNNRNVKSYRLGEYGEGDTGVTVVELTN